MSQVGAAGKSSREPQSQTSTMDKSSGEPRSQMSTKDKSSGEPESQTSTTDKSSGKEKSPVGTTDKSLGDVKSQVNATDKSLGESESQTGTTDNFSGSPESQAGTRDFWSSLETSGEEKSHMNTTDNSCRPEKSMDHVTVKASSEPEAEMNTTDRSSEPQPQASTAERSGEPQPQASTADTSCGEQESYVATGDGSGKRGPATGDGSGGERGPATGDGSGERGPATGDGSGERGPATGDWSGERGPATGDGFVTSKYTDWPRRRQLTSSGAHREVLVKATDQTFGEPKSRVSTIDTCFGKGKSQTGTTDKSGNTESLPIHLIEEKHTTRYRLLIGGFTVLVVFGVLASSLLSWKGQPPTHHDSVLEIFLKEFASLKKDFPGQNKGLWFRSEKLLQKHLNMSHPSTPSILILTAAQDGERTLHCVSKRLAKSYADSLSAKWLMVYGPSKSDYDSADSKMQIDNELSSGFQSDSRAAVLHRLETLPPGSLLILYKYCDHENAAFKNVALVLTVLLEEHSLETDLSFTEVEEKVKDFLWERFAKSEVSAHNEMDVDKLSGVWSRISHVVLPVRPVGSIESGSCPGIED